MAIAGPQRTNREKTKLPKVEEGNQRLTRSKEEG
jgi:hypothetical protein